MKSLSKIAVILFAIILCLGIAKSFVFASEGEEVTQTPASNPSTNSRQGAATATPIEVTPTCTPTPKKKKPTPTEIIATITEKPAPTATAEATLTPTATPGAAFTPTPTEISQGTPTPTGVSQAGPTPTSAPVAADIVEEQKPGAQQGQVLGAAAMAPTGNFQAMLMKIYTILGMYLLLVGYASYAKERRYN